MASINDNSALLLYRVGPVLCCAPCLPISAIIVPPALTRPPGSDSGRPGIFKHANAIVTELDLRHQFGVDETTWASPGRSIVTLLEKSCIGFHVDEIRDVISMPASGWGALPAPLPRGIFSRTLLHKDQIYLYAEFQALQHIPYSGYLHQYIQQLLASPPSQQSTAARREFDASTTASSTPVSPKQAVADVTQATPKPRQAITHAKPSASTRPVATPPLHTNQRRKILDDSRPQQAGASPHTSAARPLRQANERPARPADVTTHAATPKRTPAPTSSPAPRRPASQVHTISKPVSPTTQPSMTTVTDRPHVAKTTTAQTTSAQVPGGSDHGLLIGLVLLVLVGVSGAGLWYVLGTDNSSPEQVSASIHNTEASVDSPVPDTQTVYPTAATPQAADSEQLATTSLHDNATHPVTNPVPPSADKVAAPATTASTPDRHSDQKTDYHANIEKDSQGLTITLDVPPDDPAFQQTPPTPVATKADAAAAKDDVAVPATPAVAATRTPPVPAANSAPATAAVRTVEIIHVVVKGDTLWDIAKRYVKDPFRYPELARLSKIKNPDLIYPGDRVRIIKRIRQP